MIKERGSEEDKSMEDLHREFRQQFFDETGIIVRHQTQRYVHGTIGYGYDSGVTLRHILFPLYKHAEELNLVRNIISEDDQGEISNMLLSLELGQAYIYTGNQGEDDIASIVGNVHLVRKIGKILHHELDQKQKFTNEHLLHQSFVGTWLRGRSPYDTFIPSVLHRALKQIGKQHKLVSNPSLKEFDGNLVFRFFGNVDGRCFLLGGHDSLNLIGDDLIVKQVVNFLNRPFEKLGGRFVKVGE